jgi:hypothetical protein
MGFTYRTDRGTTISAAAAKIAATTACTTDSQRIRMRIQFHQRVPTPTPPSSTLGKAGRNILNKEITPLLPTGYASDRVKPYQI